MYEAEQIFAYEIKANSAIIWRCFSHAAKAEIPERLEGYPVVEVASYAFSAHMDPKEVEQGLACGRLRLYVPELFRTGQRTGTAKGMEADFLNPDAGYMEDDFLKLPGSGKSFPALCGDALEEIVLPPSLKRVGRYCFYNCAHLQRIAFCGGLLDWGSGVFTGCHQVKELRVYTDEEGRSGLKDVLDELREALQVEYYLPGAESEITGGKPYAEVSRSKCFRCTKLVFPEFYEEGVENTPARILETRVHGSGILYRNCFRNRAFDFAQYDRLFSYARAQEPQETVARLVTDRLRYPLALEEPARARYERYVLDNGRELAALLLDEQDLEGVRWLLELVKKNTGGPLYAADKDGRTRGADKAADKGTVDLQGLLEYMTRRAMRLHLKEIVSFLMDYRRVHSPAPKRYRRLEL